MAGQKLLNWCKPPGYNSNELEPEAAIPSVNL